MERMQWIGPADGLAVGRVGFLIESSNAVAGWVHHRLSDVPAHTNRSFEPRLYGWCGTENDVATFARQANPALVDVNQMRHAKAGSRAVNGDRLTFNRLGAAKLDQMLFFQHRNRH